MKKQSKIVRFRIDELKAVRRRVTGERCTNKTIVKATGIAESTLSRMNTGENTGVNFNTLLKLMEFFDLSSFDDLMVVQEVAT